VPRALTTDDLTPAQKSLVSLIARIESVEDLPFIVRSVLRSNKALLMKKIAATSDDEIRNLYDGVRSEMDKLYAQL
jgi:hypothetical protein